MTGYYVVTSQLILLLVTNLTQYCSGDKIGKNEMGGACSAYREEEKRFGGETWREETAWEDQA